jgi:hypothetical protein
MASIGDIAAGVKIRLLADLDYFPEGTEGTVQAVRGEDDAIWHAIVTWSDKIRKRRIRGVLKPNDLDYIEIIPGKIKYRPVQLSIPFPEGGSDEWPVDHGIALFKGR